MSNSNKVNAGFEFLNLNYGTVISTGSMTKVEAKVSLDMVSDYAEEYVKRLKHANIQRFEATGLTKEKLEDYFKAIIYLRVLSINGELTEWRQCKQLYIPQWLQNVIALLGRVVETDLGISIEPVMDKLEYDFADLLETSSKLQFFIADGFHLYKDAFPRTDTGSKEMMSFTIKNGMVYATSAKPNPSYSYAAGFLGLEMSGFKDKLAFPIPYDEVDFIKLNLLHDEVIF